jgi:hypothetical protein
LRIKRTDTDGLTRELWLERTVGLRRGQQPKKADMRGEQKLRQGAELYRHAADRSNTPSAREDLLHCAAELSQLAEWIETMHDAASNREPDEH